MSAGAYLREHRNAAGVTHDDVAVLMRLLNLAPRSLPAGVLALPELLACFEEDKLRTGTAELMALRLAFEFSPATYRRLCDQADAQAACQPERLSHD